MNPPGPPSKTFRFILFPMVLTYVVVSVFFGGWPLNLVLQDGLFNSGLALILIAICILHSRNTFPSIKRGFLVEAAIFLGIIAVAAYFRFEGVDERALSGPTMDEPILVDPVLAMLKTGSYDFKRYEYGGVYFYILLIVFVFTTLSLIKNYKYRAIDQIPQVEYYTAARMATAFFSVVTVACTYLFARKYFGKIPAICAGLLLTFSTLSFLTAHLIRVDVVLALWILLAHWFFLKILDEPKSMNYVFAGIFCGLAIGTKSTVVPIFVSLLITHSLARKETSLNWNLFISLLCGAGVYFITNFFVFANLNQFLVLYPTALYHLNPAHWSSVPNRSLEYSLTLMGNGIGVVACVLAFITLPRVVHSNRFLILWSFPLLYFLTIGSYSAGFPRYLLPILPLLSILAGEGFRSVFEWIQSQSELVRRWSHAVAVLGLVLIVAQPAWLTIHHYSEAAKILRPKEVTSWIEKNIPQGSQILADPTGPTIPGDRYEVRYLSYGQFMNPRNVKNYQYVCVTEDLFNKIPPTYDVLHEFPSRTKSLDRSVRIYKARDKGSF